MKKNHKEYTLHVIKKNSKINGTKIDFFRQKNSELINVFDNIP